ncbi:unnamed protein product [Coffea canephora]|nr:unnamed protein product [Coffea canephora]
MFYSLLEESVAKTHKYGWWQWVPLESRSISTDATYSCDGNLLYASFRDGNIFLFTAAALELRCQISPSAYLPSNRSLHPLVIAAHPSEPGQFAVGLTDGGVYIVKPPVRTP